jgi:polysaccharide export outer membrane protein
LGEVARAGVFEVPDDHITLAEAIGLAGDLTAFARRDNVLVIRDVNGKKEMGRVNLNAVNALQSPFYNLQQDDVVYIEPSQRKLPNADQTAIRNISILSGVISSLALVITIFIR